MVKETVVFALTSSTDLAASICKKLNLPLGKIKVEHFADGEILVSEHMNDCNTFDAPNTVEPKKFDVSLENGKLSFKLPKMSACVITLK